MSQDLTLKFLFANHDGVSVELSFAESTPVSTVKTKLIESWPVDRVTKASTDGIRLLCMGKLLEDAKTLADARIPRYDHATPVNVSLLPMGKSYSEAKAPVKEKDDGNKAPSSSGGCCTVQ